MNIILIMNSQTLRLALFLFKYRDSNIKTTLVIDTYVDLSSLMGYLATVLASINVFGGFVVTQRMLAMYKKKNKNDKNYFICLVDFLA